MTEHCEKCGLPPDLCICEEKEKEEKSETMVFEFSDNSSNVNAVKAMSVGKHTIDKESGDVVIRGIIQDVDETYHKDTGKGIEIIISNEEVQKLIREALPTEEQHMQALLDKIHKIRVDRVLSVEDIDKRLTNLLGDVKTEFDKAKTQTEIKRCEASFRVRLAIITQKRHIAKFSIQEESELSLALAKLRRSKSG